MPLVPTGPDKYVSFQGKGHGTEVWYPCCQREKKHHKIYVHRNGVEGAGEAACTLSS